MKTKERRHSSPETTQMQADRLTKQIIICSVCFTTLMVTSTMCYLSVRADAIPDQIDRLATLLVGALVGSLIKTGVDAINHKSDEPVQVTTPPDEPLKTTEVKSEENSDEQ